MLEKQTQNQAPEATRFVVPETVSWRSLTSDPAALVILYALSMKPEFELVELERLIPPDLNDLFEKILTLLLGEGIIEMTETKLRLKKPNEMLCVFDAEALLKSLPKINSYASSKSLMASLKNAYGNGCRFFFYPEEQEEEALAILRETRAKFQALIEKRTNTKSKKMGYVSIISTQLGPDDFI